MRMRIRNLLAVTLAAGALVAAVADTSGAYPRPGRTEVVTLDENGNQAESIRTPAGNLSLGDHLCPGSDLSSDGRYVVFSSFAALVEEDSNLTCDIYLHDRSRDKVARVSVATDGSQALPGGKDVLDRMDLDGDFGTTGKRIVFSLPLSEIGLPEGGRFADVEAFTGIGTSTSGATKVLDRVRLLP